MLTSSAIYNCGLYANSMSSNIFDKDKKNAKKKHFKNLQIFILSIKFIYYTRLKKKTSNF